MLSSLQLNQRDKFLTVDVFVFDYLLKKKSKIVYSMFFVPNQTQREWGFIIVIPLCGSENLLCCNLHSRPFLGGRPANPLLYSAVEGSGLCVRV